jgi:hypothetical protein
MLVGTILQLLWTISGNLRSICERFIEDHLHHSVHMIVVKVNDL